MSNISETEIKAMSKEQNYIRGYRDGYIHGYNNGKSDILGNIKAEIEQNAYQIVHGVNNHEKGMTLYGILQIIDKYKAEG